MFLLFLWAMASEPATTVAAKTRCLQTYWEACDAMVVQDFVTAKNCFLACAQQAPYCPVVLRFLEWLRTKKHLRDGELAPLPELKFILDNPDWIPEDETLAGKHVKAMEYYWTYVDPKTKKQPKETAGKNLEALANQTTEWIPFASVLYWLAMRDHNYISRAMNQCESWAFHRYMMIPGNRLPQDSSAAWKALSDSAQRDVPIGQIEFDYGSQNESQNNWRKKGIQLCSSPDKAKTRNPQTKKISKEWEFLSAFAGDSNAQTLMSTLFKNGNQKIFTDLLLQNPNASKMQKALAWKELARSAEQQKQFDKAGICYYETYCCDPNNLTSTRNLVIAINKGWYRGKDINELIDASRKIMSAAPNQDDRDCFYRELSIFYTSMKEKKTEVLKEWGEAEAYVELFNMVQRQEYEAADEEWDIFLKISSDGGFPVLYADHFKFSHPEKAKQALLMVANPSKLIVDIKNLFYLLTAQFAKADKKEDWKGVVTVCLEKIKSPQTGHFLNNMAVLYEELKRFAEAEPFHRQNVEKDPFNSTYLYNLGNNLLNQYDPFDNESDENQERLDEAKEILRKAANLGDHSAVLKLIQYSPADRNEETLKRIESIQSAEADYARGLIYLCRNKRDLAIESLKSSMESLFGPAHTFCAIAFNLDKSKREWLLKEAEKLGCLNARRIYTYMDENNGELPKNIYRKIMREDPFTATDEHQMQQLFKQVSPFGFLDLSTID